MILSSIDIGTNTVLLLTAQADTKNKKILPLLNEYRIPRIGKNLAKSGVISEESVRNLEKILLEYREIALSNGSEKIFAVATAAFRTAENGAEVVDYIKSTTGILIKIIPGDEEAVYSYLGVSDNLSPDMKRMLIDIGGGSTEIIFGSGDNIVYLKSFNTGVVTSSEAFRSSRDLILSLQEFYREKFSELSLSGFYPDETYAVAGTPTTLASVKMNQPKFNEQKIEGSVLTIQDLEDFIRNYSAEPQYYQKKFREIITGREDLIIPGTLILKQVMEYLNVDEVKVSTRGIRHGVIIKWLRDEYSE